MPLDDALPFLSRNFDNFVEMMKQKITAVNEWLAPDSKVSCLLNLLAEGSRLSLEEMMDVDKYVQSVLKKLSGAASMGSRISGQEERPKASVSRSLLDSVMDVSRTGERRHGMDAGFERAPDSRQSLTMGSVDRDRGMDKRNDGLLRTPLEEGLYSLII